MVDTKVYYGSHDLTVSNSWKELGFFDGTNGLDWTFQMILSFGSTNILWPEDLWVKRPKTCTNHVNGVFCRWHGGSIVPPPKPEVFGAPKRKMSGPPPLPISTPVTTAPSRLLGPMVMPPGGIRTTIPSTTVPARPIRKTGPKGYLRKKGDIPKVDPIEPVPVTKRIPGGYLR